MKTAGSQDKGRVEIVRYTANVSVDLRGPVCPNGVLPRIGISEEKNDYAKTERREVDSLAYLKAETVQPMGVSSHGHPLSRHRINGTRDFFCRVFGSHTRIALSIAAQDLR